MNNYLDILLHNESVKIFIMSMLPIAELRFSIPYGIFSTSLPITQVVLLSIIGNIFIGLLIIYFIGPVMTFLKKYRSFNKIVVFIFNRTRQKGKIIYRLQFIGLILFIGIPFPLTGVWTGSLAAYLFGLSKRHSVIAIFLGVIISSSVVTIISLFTKHTI